MCLYIVDVLCVVYALCHVWFVSQSHQTPLHISSREGHTPVVSLLLSQERVDVNTRDEVC